MADAPMSIPEILAAMQALLDSVNASAGTGDAAPAPLTDDQANRYEELEGMLKAAQRTDEIQKRNAAYRTNVTSMPIARGNANHGTSDVHGVAFRSYLRGQSSPELAQYRAQGEAVGSQGGYLVPEGFREKLIERLKAFGGFGMAAEQLTTDSGNPLPYPTVDDTGNTGAIVSEGSTFASGNDFVIATRSLGAYKYMAGGGSNLPLKVSTELLQDSAFDVEAYLAKALGMRLARKFATDWVNGSGVNEPQGVLSAGGGLTGASAIASNTVGPTYLELVTIVHSLDPAYRAGAKWVFNDQTLAKINKLVDSNGRPLVWNNNVDLSAAGGGLTLLGYPVIIDQAFPDPSGSNHFGLFGDVGQTYVVRNVKAVTLVTLNELYAPNGQVGFLAWARMDGMVQDVNASVLLTAAA